MSAVVFIHKIHCVTHTLRHQHNNTSINPPETTQTEESPLLSLTQGALVAGETPYEGLWWPTPRGPDGLMGSEEMCQFFVCLWAGRETVCLLMMEWKSVCVCGGGPSVTFVNGWWVKANVQLRLQTFEGLWFGWWSVFLIHVQMNHCGCTNHYFWFRSVHEAFKGFFFYTVMM